jgi:hypothetical protein
MYFSRNFVVVFMHTFCFNLPMEDELKEKLHREIDELEDSLLASERQIKTHSEVGKLDPFSFIGKIAVVALVVALLVGGGIYVGTMMTDKGQTMEITKKAHPSLFPSEEPTSSLLPTDTSITTSALDKSIVVAGLKDSAFKTYQIDYPSSWTASEEKSEATKTLTLTNGVYLISIYQAPMGGGGCTYEGDPEKMMFKKFKNYSELQGSTYKLRMSWDDPTPTTTYSVCSLSDDNNWVQPTPYGGITVKAPNPSDPNTMADIQAILASLTSK